MTKCNHPDHNDDTGYGHPCTETAPSIETRSIEYKTWKFAPVAGGVKCDLCKEEWAHSVQVWRRGNSLFFCAPCAAALLDGMPDALRSLWPAMTRGKER